MTDWLAVGTSPGVRRRLSVILQEIPVDRTITCNGGIRFLPRPDVYVLVDHVAVTHYEEEAIAAHAQGTDVISPHLNPSMDGIRARAEAQGHKVVDVRKYRTSVSRLVPLEGFEPLRLSGTFSAEYAARQEGTDRVILVGFDGYATDGSSWYEEGVYGHELTAGRPPPGAIVLHDLNGFSATRFSTLFRKYPRVQWTFVGLPLYADRLQDAPNVDVIDLSAASSGSEGGVLQDGVGDPSGR